MSNDGTSLEIFNATPMTSQGDLQLLKTSSQQQIIEPVAGSSFMTSSDLDLCQPMPLTIDSVTSHDVKTVVKKSSRQSSRKVVKKTVQDKTFKRGQYANYGPALRAEIAKFASTHGNQVKILLHSLLSLSFITFSFFLYFSSFPIAAVQLA